MITIAGDMQKPVLRCELNRCELKAAELQGNRVKQILSEDRHLTDGAFSFNEAWKLKKKLFPRCADAPFAVLDKNHNLVADYEGILDVMKEEFTYRLRNRNINPEYEELRSFKEYLCELRLRITKSGEFDRWTMKDLETAISRLKTNKCKDPLGHINELYKHLGEDGLKSLLDLLNRIKEELIIPTKLNLSNVSTIYKGKGSKQDVQDF